MELPKYIPLSEAADLEGAHSHGAFLKYCARKRIPLMRDPGDKRKCLYPTAALSPVAHDFWLKGQTRQELNAGLITPRVNPGDGRVLQPALPFSAPVNDMAAAGPPMVPEKHAKLIDFKVDVLGQVLNHGWMKYRGERIAGIEIRNEHDYVCAMAASARQQGMKGFWTSAIYEWKKMARDVHKDSSIPKNQKWAVVRARLLPKPHPGRSGYDFFSEEDNQWQWPTLRGLYLGLAKLSVKRAWELLWEEIERREIAAQGKCIYNRPTLSQCRAALKRIDWPSRIMGREGQEAYRNRCEVVFSRDPDSLKSNDLWVTDQRVDNVILQDAGHRLGRIWKVNDLDVAAERWLGCAFGPVLDSDMVMTAHVSSIARHGVPQNIQHDLGKEFKCHAFNGTFHRFSGKTLYREALGLWGRLGVNPVQAIGGNPQTKTIERWHQEVDRFDKEFITWCGSDTDERPDEELAPIIARHRAFWFEARGSDPGIPTIEEYISRFLKWAEEKWNATHRGEGKYLRGMTPNQAFMAKRPAAGFRFIPLDELEEKSSEHRMQTVKRGGMVKLQFHGLRIDYHAPELFQFAGARPPVEVEVVISRRRFDVVTVWYPIGGGRASCIAHALHPYPWLPQGEEARERLRAAIRSRSRVKSIVRQGIKADRLLAVAENPVDLLERQQQLPPKAQLAGQKLFGTPPAKPAERKFVQAEELEIVSIEARHSEADELPSLHDYQPVTVEHFDDY